MILYVVHQLHVAVDSKLMEFHGIIPYSGIRKKYGRGLSIVPVARYSACEVVWHMWGQLLIGVAVYGVR